MPCPDLSATSPKARAPDANSVARVLWVGRLSPEKRPHWVLDIAERCPMLRFDIVGHANRATEFSTTFLDRAESLDNVTIHGAVSHDKIAAFYANASALLCTSEFEGFPNVFLEAWSVGLPVVSTFDPDGLIASKGLGCIRASIAELGEAVTAITSDAELWQQASTKAREYFARNHKVDESMSRFVAVFSELTGTAVTPDSAPLDRSV